MDKYWWVWPVTVFASVNSFGWWLGLAALNFRQGMSGTDEMSV